MHAFLPPSSSVTCLSRSAAPRAMARPVGTLPISAMRGISGCATSAAPQSAPPVTTLITPGGTTSPIELHHAIRRQRRLLRRLHDHRVAGGERRGHLRRREHQRMVVRDDPRAHAERLAQRHVDGAARPSGSSRPSLRRQGRRNTRAAHAAACTSLVISATGLPQSAASISASSPACSRSRCGDRTQYDRPARAGACRAMPETPGARRAPRHRRRTHRPRRSRRGCARSRDRASPHSHRARAATRRRSGDRDDAAMHLRPSSPVRRRRPSLMPARRLHAAAGIRVVAGQHARVDDDNGTVGNLAQAVDDRRSQRVRRRRRDRCRRHPAREPSPRDRCRDLRSAGRCHLFSTGRPRMIATRSWCRSSL